MVSTLANRGKHPVPYRGWVRLRTTMVSLGIAAVSKHPDHRANLNRVRRIKGQMDGVERMIEEGRYCPEILVQTRAIASAIRGLEKQLLERHLHHCVAQAFTQPDESIRDEKVEELLDIFSRRLDK